MATSGFCGSVAAAAHPSDTHSREFLGSDVGSHLRTHTASAFGRGSQSFGNDMELNEFEDDIDTATRESQIAGYRTKDGSVLDQIFAGKHVRTPFPLKPVSFRNQITRDIHIRFPDGWTVEDLITFMSDETNHAQDSVSYEVKLPQNFLVELFGMEGMKAADGYKVALLSAHIVEQIGLPISVSLQLISNTSTGGETKWFQRSSLVMNGTQPAHVSYMIPARSSSNFHDNGNAGRLVYRTAGHVETKSWRLWATVDMEQLRTDLIALGHNTTDGRVTVLTLNPDKLTPDTTAEYFIQTQFMSMLETEKAKNPALETRNWVGDSASKGTQLIIPEQVVLERFKVIFKTIKPHRTIFFLSDVRVRITPISKSVGWADALRDAVLRKAQKGYDIEENALLEPLTFGVTIRLKVTPIVSVKKDDLIQDLSDDEVDVVND